MARGKLILVIGPTGSGKGTLIRNAREHFPDLGVLASYTTRPRRPDHVENDHYRFVSRAEFEQMIEGGDLLEWAEFSGNYYGTRNTDLEECLAAGKVVIKEMEVQGVRQVRELLPKEDFITIFVEAGPWEEVLERAMKRDPLSEDEIARRKERFLDEETFKQEADVIIHNWTGRLAEADAAFESVIKKALGEA